ncbi:lysophospholipid acyltransferase family protein [Selenomonas sp. TAMA-11512]|nr:lysophospholipid acyltransferase family protein [Selenomonas sp. TAMA-11512]
MYTLLKSLFYILFVTVFRTQSSGAENLPKEGGVLVAANHMSNLDPPLLATFLPRPLSYMAKQELFEVPLLGAIIRAAHAFPVKRGKSDRAAIKAAVTALKEGRCVGIFPEGTRSADGKRRAAEAGVALLAAMTGVPVLPAAISGTERVLHGALFPQLHIVYGTPMLFQGERGNKADLEAFSNAVMDAVYALKAGVEDR